MDEKLYFAIGDIHGCYKTLTSLVQSLPISSEHQLIFLGDYVDRGPASNQVINYLLDLSETYTCTFLKGNHELLMLDYFAFKDIESWAINGGRDTLESYAQSGLSRIPDSHVEFLTACPMYFETTDYLFVHGGVSPHKSIAENLQDMSAEDFAWYRGHLNADLFAFSQEKWEKTVVCGHTPQSEPLLLPKLICIDTGCVYSHRPGFGKLTAVELPSRKLYQKENIDMNYWH